MKRNLKSLSALVRACGLAGFLMTICLAISACAQINPAAALTAGDEAWEALLRDVQPPSAPEAWLTQAPTPTQIVKTTPA